mgnify:CR=1 FL=1
MYSAFDDSLADDFKSKGITMQEGSCESRGYSDCSDTNLSTEGVNGIKAYLCKK